MGSAPLFGGAVDEHRTFCNAPHEICRLLGLEAAKSVLHTEIEGVICEDSNSVTKSHLELVSDAMCFRGKLLAMSRHGLNRPENLSGPLVRATFEESVDQLFSAAVWGESDPAVGVSFSAMAGEELRHIGTSSFEVLLPKQDVRIQCQGGRAPSTGGRRLAKSVVTRHPSSLHDAASAPRQFCFQNTSVWCFTPGEAAEGTDEPELPYVTAEDEAPLRGRGEGHEGVKSSGGAAESCEVYVPSSPGRS